MDDKKPGLAVIIASKQKDMEKERKRGEASGKYTEMAEDLMEALKEDNAKAFGKRLKNFIAVCLEEKDLLDDDSEDGENGEY